MTNHFAALDELRRPWLDPDSLKQKFLTASAAVHPDRVHHLGEAERAAAQERYVALNAAYNCLHQPKLRLRHLLELELGALPPDIQQIPAELMDLSMAVGGLCRKADQLIAEQAGVTSPLLKVQYFERSQEQMDVLRQMQDDLTGRRNALLERLKQLDATWISDDSTAGRSQALRDLGSLYRLLAYLDRWIGQLQERVTRLSF